MIIHKFGSLFSAPSNSYLVHACNAQGVWGGGIAAKFAKLFPKSYKAYKQACRTNQVGNALVLPPENGYQVVCLVTSGGFGASLDSEKLILDNTLTSVDIFLSHIKAKATSNLQVHSCKFNSGLFGVPWEKTEDIVRPLTNSYGVDWTVWTPPTCWR